MPERPLILFPKYESAERKKRPGGSPKFHAPTYDRQVQRLQPKLKALQSAIDNGRLHFTQSPDGIEPEYTLVLEVAMGDSKSFFTAVKNLGKDNDDVEWLFELIEDDIANDEDFYKTNTKNECVENGSISCKLFCVLTNIRALSEILTLWKNYSCDESFKFPIGKTGLRDVFRNLKDIHLWGTKERLEETGILDAWREDLKDPTLPELKCEIELFFRNSKIKRIQAQRRLEIMIKELGGRVLTASSIEAIGYHALLVTIPRQYVECILENSEGVSIVKADPVMFFKPTGQAVVRSTAESFTFNGAVEMPTEINGEPVIGLFDGLPQEHHPFLEGMLVIDDPDDYTSAYQIKDRLHGTSMASLIAHSDLNSGGISIARKIYVRPIMKPYPTLRGSCEYIPDDILIVDKIHESVRRLFEPVAGAVASTVKIINLSIGIGNLLFYNRISPLARLLDWLSLKYRVLFIVSAGNHSEDINLGIPFKDFSQLSEIEKDIQMIKILDENSRHLRLLSPAESMNSLTVGAVFDDNSNYVQNAVQILPCSNSFPSPISSLGKGINHSIKPDVLFKGGRSIMLRNFLNDNEGRWRIGCNANPPGVLSAQPIDIASSSNKVAYNFGTSDATAMISHEAAKCYDILQGIFYNEIGESVPSEYVALLIKAMLVHGAEWGTVADTICKALNLPGRAADDIHKWLGYGIPNISRVEECTKSRVTLIGYGDLEKESAHLYELPLPFDFHSKKIYRCLTVTLAYFTPIKPTVQKYRAAQLWFTIEDNNKKLVPSRLNADDKAVVRGTLQHEKFCSNSAVTWGKEDSLKIRISCREDAGIFENTIPYAIFVSFEVAEGLDIDVYQDVTTKIKQKVPATAVII
ncbi:hypothetical protein SPSIL_014440 [Sporomusa silvacetica DSM 10669]|uniref:Peptidase S8/S53 domain-containing protein n=1 Tax=Sporomusa silvacetica DSM 10669 TaxID=1123289 RepID=A0ABZ3II35_9FIRM|nr:S8 family peptidase [Sporomusa silvacetica]OZC21507.1 hypothetical protein SPSIL_09170 [Sporomusa silvacetica DSM 10669]